LASAFTTDAPMSDEAKKILFGQTAATLGQAAARDKT